MKIHPILCACSQDFQYRIPILPCISWGLCHCRRLSSSCEKEKGVDGILLWAPQRWMKWMVTAENQALQWPIQVVQKHCGCYYNPMIC